MWPAALTRLLRRRILYIIIALLVFVYILTNLLEKNGALRALHYDDYTIQRTRPLLWRTLQEHVLPDELANNRTNDPALQCRNSVQGRDLLVDDRGFVCQRVHILVSGCCDVEVPDTRYYTCETCNATTNCCGVYEFCVSCCLHPSKRSLLELVLRTITGRQAAVYATVDDHFELCLSKCRTNSHSVEHENKYRAPEAKFCYGQTEAHESQREVSGSATH